MRNIGEDKYKIVGDVVYLNCPTGFGRTKLSNNILDKKLNIIATTRNLRAALKLSK